MNKIVVTGGLGFIGSNLIDLLIKKGFFVINIDKVSYASNFYNTINFKGKRNYKFFKLDINNKNKILNILNKYKPSGIFNLAAETHVDRSIDTPVNFVKSNILIPLSLGGLWLADIIKPPESLYFLTRKGMDGVGHSPI